MRKDSIGERFDLAQIIIRPLHFGMTANVLIPMALLLGTYYINENHDPSNLLGAYKDYLFALFAFGAVTEAIIAIVWRGRAMKKPMIRSMETFEQDFSDALLERSRPIFLLIATIGLYGLVFFSLTGEFKETTLFVVFSFVVFQVVRPRYGSTSNLIEMQEKLFKEGHKA